MPRIIHGTSSWSSKGWLGPLYAVSTKPGKFVVRRLPRVADAPSRVAVSSSLNLQLIPVRVMANPMDETSLSSLLRNVVAGHRVDRWTGVDRSPKLRRKFLAALDHFRDFDPSVVVELTPATDSPSGILHALRSRGAGATCRIVCADPAFDDKVLPLPDAIEQVCGFVEGSLLICNPRLALYEGEPPKNRFVLCRVERGSRRDS